MGFRFQKVLASQTFGPQHYNIDRISCTKFSKRRTREAPTRHLTEQNKLFLQALGLNVIQ